MSTRFSTRANNVLWNLLGRDPEDLTDDEICVAIAAGGPAARVRMSTEWLRLMGTKGCGRRSANEICDALGIEKTTENRQHAACPDCKCGKK